MPRTPQEIFDHHLQALLARDVDELLVDYTDESELITPAGVARGSTGIRAAFSQLSAALADADFEIKSQTYSGNVLLLEWTLDAPGARGVVVDGVDTFLFDDDSIRVQTISQQMHPKS
ncbi:nuclear transport factor 2 family protein [Mycolicibacter icosiumassiliensis]|uniref:nuclear transport factor 2 family protein n=1 Tax=Mycolicibacter icosiumassiliensis TaxID=1792835 RepID=UPI00082A3D0E|nr:nuclear transport factor 2 family protein [Mycolicibacter icosiumassiliensis]